MSALRERLLRRVYDSSVNALSMATGYTLTNYYTETIGMVFVSMTMIIVCEYMLYVIELNMPKKDIGVTELIEVCRLQQELIQHVNKKNTNPMNTFSTFHQTSNSIDLLLSSNFKQKNDLRYPFFVLLQEVLKIISRSAYFFATYFLVKLYSSYSNILNEYVTLLYFSVIIILAPIIFIMLHAVIISPNKPI